MQGEHPADRLIREMIATRRRATPEEVAAIVARMANAPFDRRIVPVRVVERGVAYQGHSLGAREDSLRYHLTGYQFSTWEKTGLPEEVIWLK